MVRYRYWWVRTSVRGAPDATRVKQAVAQGWELVSAGDWPEGMPTSYDNLGKDNLALYRLPEIQAQEHQARLQNRNATEFNRSVDAYLRRDRDTDNAKFAFYPGHEDLEPRREPKPAYTAATFYSPENLVIYPDRAVELAAYKAHVAEHGERFPMAYFVGKNYKKPRRKTPK
jgi:hypothetical protein